MLVPNNISVRVFNAHKDDINELKDYILNKEHLYFKEKFDESVQSNVIIIYGMRDISKTLSVMTNLENNSWAWREMFKKRKIANPH